MTRGVVLAACAVLAQVDAAGQTPLTDDTPHLRIGVEARRDRIEASDVTTREMTSAQEHAIFGGAAATWILRGPWHLSASGEIAPVVLARLLVQLPDKYPGQDLVFIGKVAAGSARIIAQASRVGGRRADGCRHGVELHTNGAPRAPDAWRAALHRPDLVSGTTGC
jgi:hypothetical protein